MKHAFPHLPAHFTLGQEKKWMKSIVRPTSTKKEEVKGIIYVSLKERTMLEIDENQSRFQNYSNIQDCLY